MAVDRPWRAAMSAAFSPAGPAPRTITSNCCLVINHSWLSESASTIDVTAGLSNRQVPDTSRDRWTGSFSTYPFL
jgi:hypothetical protein